MILALGIIIFIIGCCVSSYEDSSYNAERKAEQRHRELIKALDEARKQSQYPTKKHIKKVQRRFVKDKNGNTIGEEITEEEYDD